MTDTIKRNPNALELVREVLDRHHEVESISALIQHGEGLLVLFRVKGTLATSQDRVAFFVRGSIETEGDSMFKRWDSIAA